MFLLQQILFYSSRILWCGVSKGILLVLAATNPLLQQSYFVVGSKQGYTPCFGCNKSSFTAVVFCGAELARVYYLFWLQQILYCSSRILWYRVSKGILLVLAATNPLLQQSYFVVRSKQGYTPCFGCNKSSIAAVVFCGWE